MVLMVILIINYSIIIILVETIIIIHFNLYMVFNYFIYHYTFIIIWYDFHYYLPH